MTKLYPDPDIEKLIDEMNDEEEWRHSDASQGADGFVDSLQSSSKGRVAPGEPLGHLLTEMVHRKATDLLLVPGALPVVRVDGVLMEISGDLVTQSWIVDLLEPHMGGVKNRELKETGAVDFSLRLESGVDSEGGAQSGCRIRLNLHRQRGQLAAALRMLPSQAPTLSQLNLPPQIGELAKLNRGLIIVSGPTGSGKTSTLAALINLINTTQKKHIITIEDPIEYEHQNHQSIVEQIEIGTDARSFTRALRSSLRRDPDVILVGEMRDLETMAAAVTAAETGHLILSTLHTGDTTQAVHRIVDVFPADQQQQVRHQLSLSLAAIVAQQLLPVAKGPGRVPAVEILMSTNAVRHQIRVGAMERIYNELHSGQRYGMCTVEQSLADLVAKGRISVEEAQQRAPRLEELKRLI